MPVPEAKSGHNKMILHPVYKRREFALEMFAVNACVFD